MHKQLTQVGINRALWIMLMRLGGKVTIPERLLEQPNPEDAIEINYDPSIKSFTFLLHKVKTADESRIIWAGEN